VSFSDQGLCMTVLGLFALCSSICVVFSLSSVGMEIRVMLNRIVIERRLCPLDAAAPSATGA